MYACHVYVYGNPHKDRTGKLPLKLWFLWNLWYVSFFGFLYGMCGISPGDPAKVATIAANGDEQIGKMITEAFEKAGWMMNW